MAHVPLCKTAIVSFLVDKETIPKLWNLSSNMRKRLQMILEQIEIILREYNENILKIKEWVIIGEGYKSIKSIEDIKKGVSNYKLDNQEQIDKIVSLNGKLGCANLYFEPEAPIEFDQIKYLTIFPTNYDFYSKCSFNKIDHLILRNLSSSQIKHLIAKFKQIKLLKIEDCSISDLDLRLANTSSFEFDTVTFSGEVKLPSNLDYLHLSKCENFHFLKCNRVTNIDLITKNLKDSRSLLKSLQGIKEVSVNFPLSEFIDYLPNTVRKLNDYSEFDLDDNDYDNLDTIFPFLIELNEKIPIEREQTLNLRSILPIIYETKEKFTLRPKKIKIDRENVMQLNKHPELFEKVRKLNISTYKLNFDFLPSEMKEIEFDGYSSERKNLENLQKNSWKFENSLISFLAMEKNRIRKVLNCLSKVKKVKVPTDLKALAEEYPQFRFATK